MLKGLSIRWRVVLIALLALALPLLAAVHSIYQVSEISKDTEEVTNQDIPITKVLTRLTILQLKKAVEFERAIGLGERMDLEPAVLPRFVATVADFERGFAEVDRQFGRLISDLEQHTAESASDLHGVEFQRLLDRMRGARVKHDEYGRGARLIFEALRTGQWQDETPRVDEVAETEKSLDRTLAAALLEIESFTERSMQDVDQREKTALLIMLSLTVIGMIFGPLMGIAVGRSVSTPITRLTRTVRRLGEGDTEVEIPDLGDRKDEIAVLSRAVQDYRDNLILSRQLADERDRRILELEDAQKRLSSQAAELVHLSEDLHDAKQQLNDAVDSISEGFALWDSDDALIRCNARYKNIYPDLVDLLEPGTGFTDFVRGAYERGVFPLDAADVETAVEQRRIRHQTAVAAYEQELGDGRWIRVSKRRTKSGHKVAILSDITSRVESDATIRRMAMEDPLTGLPNRARFQDLLKEALDQADRTDRLVGVMLLDLDRFKSVNDTLGHAAGDELLKQVSERIRACLRKTDFVARLGGDEFAVIVTNAQQAEAVHKVGEKIIDVLAQPFDVEGREVHTGTSIGMTIFPDDRGDQGQLMRNADLALYKAKEEGRGNCWLYDEHLHHKVQAMSALERDLREAFAVGQLSMVYQPQIDLRSGALVGAETLIRWEHPERGFVSPSEFIPLAESTRQIIEISAWQIGHVCQQVGAWLESGIDVPRVSLNISPLHFRQENLLDQFEIALRESGLDPCHLEIEITESLAMAAGEATLRILEQLKAMGLALAIDDFGTGYSSLSRLKDFPVDRLKIDQSFVQNVTSNEDDAAITSAVVQLGHSLNLRVIAEGVETLDQIDFLADLGCDEAQGFFFSRPVPADDFAAFVEAYEPKPASELRPKEDRARAPSEARKRA